MIGNISHQNTTTEAEPQIALRFQPNQDGPPPPSRKCTKRLASAAQLDSDALPNPIPSFDLLTFLDLIGNPKDSDSLAYWRVKDTKTGGKIIDRFCHELHNYATTTFDEDPPSDQTIQTMFGTAKEWYLKPNRNRGKLATHHIHLY
jgi:hypothetical protein